MIRASGFGAEYSVLDGVLRIGNRVTVDPYSGLVNPVSVAVWEAGDASVVSHFYGDRQNADIIATFRSFDLRIVDGRVVMTPALKDDVVQESPAALVLVIPDLGLIHVQALTTTNARTVPSWSGLEVEGGELFLVERSGDDDHYVLVGSSTITTISPDDPADPSLPEKINGAVSARWTAE